MVPKSCDMYATLPNCATGRDHLGSHRLGGRHHQVVATVAELSSAASAIATAKRGLRKCGRVAQSECDSSRSQAYEKGAVVHG